MTTPTPKSTFVKQPVWVNGKKVAPVNVVAVAAVEEPEPEPLPTYSISAEVDSDHVNVGKGIFDHEAKTLTLYLHDGMVVRQIRKPAIERGVRDQVAEGTVFDYIVADTNTKEVRTCKWFTPPAFLVEGGAEISEHYEFDRPNVISTCSNEQVKQRYNLPNPQCDHEQSMITCPFYAPAEWETTQSAELTLKDETTSTIELRTILRSFGIRYWQITQVTDDSTKVIDEFGIKDLGDNVDEALSNRFNAAINTLDPQASILLAQPETPVVIKNRYFDYVTSG